MDVLKGNWPLVVATAILSRRGETQFGTDHVNKVASTLSNVTEDDKRKALMAIAKAVQPDFEEKGAWSRKNCSWLVRINESQVVVPSGNVDWTFRNVTEEQAFAWARRMTRLPHPAQKPDEAATADAAVSVLAQREPARRLSWVERRLVAHARHMQKTGAAPAPLFTSVVHATHLNADMQNALTALQVEKLPQPVRVLWVAHGHAEQGSKDPDRMYARAWERSSRSMVYLNLAAILQRFRDYADHVRGESVPPVRVSEHASKYSSSAWVYQGEVEGVEYSEKGVYLDQLLSTKIGALEQAWRDRIEGLFLDTPVAGAGREWYEFSTASQATKPGSRPDELEGGLRLTWRRFDGGLTRRDFWPD